MDQKNQKFERKISWMGLSQNLTKSDEKINIIKKNSWNDCYANSISQNFHEIKK